jgi:hypothetical protein
VTPVGDGSVPRALSLSWKLLLNATLLLAPALVLGLLAPVLGIALWVGSGKAALLAAAGVAVVLAAQILWAGAYPEWPLNQLLLHRLRNRCRPRQTGVPHDWIETARMVEWVPRENWAATQLDTAEDVMLIRVNHWGVEMEGDAARYQVPASSIIDVEVESIRPTGCFHWLHFVILTVRGENGPMEFPLSFRDHKLGRLRSSHRQRQAYDLSQMIRAVATGGEMTYRVDIRHEVTTQRAYSQTANSAAGSVNPYAAPRAV